MRAPSDQQSLFQLRGVPPLGSAVSLSLQHLVAMIVGCVTPPIIIAGAIGLSQTDRVLLIQASLVMSAVCTIIQLYPAGKYFGSGLPVIMGVSFAYVPSMQAIASTGGGVGAIAGAMAENNRLTYIADYPIYGSIANINAFALGAKMINPRAQVFLEWTAKKDTDVMENVLKMEVDCISGKDMVIPEEGSRFFGIYHLEGEIARNLAMPIWHWGKFYEQMIRAVMDGTWKYDDDPTSKKAINYWWGMSAGVVDVVCSQNLPIGTKRLIEVLRETISSGQFNPFSGVLYSQEGIVQDDPSKELSPEEIVTMDWLAENVIGSIPKEEELKEQSKPVVSQQGIENKKG